MAGCVVSGDKNAKEMYQYSIYPLEIDRPDLVVSSPLSPLSITVQNQNAKELSILNSVVFCNTRIFLPHPLIRIAHFRIAHIQSPPRTFEYSCKALPAYYSSPSGPALISQLSSAGRTRRRVAGRSAAVDASG